MTAGEEQLLTAYLLSTGEIEEAGHFTGWYAAIRNGSAGGEVEYKEVLALAGAWRRGFHQGYVAAQEPPEAEGLPRPRRHFHVQAYRLKREPERPIKNLAITTVTGGYLSRSAANRAAWRDFPEEITSVRECQDLDCGLVASQRGGHYAAS